MIVTIMLADVIFFAVVFLYLDDTAVSLVKNFAKAEPWLLCLLTSGGNKQKCVDLGAQWLLSESTVAAVLIMLSLAGLQCFLLLFRWSMFTGWKEFITSKFSRKQEFVSLDALATQQGYSSRSASTRGGPSRFERKYGAKGTTFEMQQPPTQYGMDVDMKMTSPTITDINSPSQSFMNSPPQSYINSPPDSYHSPLRMGPISPDGIQGTPDYFISQSPERHYHAPTQSFSGPRMPSRQNSGSGPRLPTRQNSVRSMDWDPRNTYARGGPGFYPPLPEDAQNRNRQQY